MGRMKFLEARELAVFIAKELNNKKAENIDVLNVSTISNVTDYFVICTGTSSVHNKALCDIVLEKCREADIVPLRVEGKQSSGWILIDFGHAVVHIFKKDLREFYGLDRLWSDAEKININF